MRGALLLLALIVLSAVIMLLSPGADASGAESAVFALGFLLLASYIIGAYTLRLRMPMLTGYLLAGLFFGPFVFGALLPHCGVLSTRTLDRLGLIDSLALGLIAFTAGGELRIAELKPRIATIGRVSLAQLIVVFFGTSLLMFPLIGLLPFGGHLGWPAMLSLALLLAVVCTANSPATTVAVINECRARGPMSTITLGVTVLKDVLVMVLFSVVLIAARLLTDQEGAADARVGLLVFWEVLGSLGLGIVLGWLLSAYISRVKTGLPLLLLALSFLSVELGRELHLSGVLLNIAAGFYVMNYSKQGPRMIEALERYSLPVFIIFFAVAGAKIDLPALKLMWPMALLLILARLVFTWLGTRLALNRRERNKEYGPYLWLAFISQAGVSLGIASEIGRSLPELGSNLRTLIVATIAINQVIGPITFRYALVRADEVDQS
ncbi:MAG: cation:proton antiporter [Candidatus Alcyoniella australis]|nr:cation:proton antiporter [Candidatus Alcyoniella australis]